MFVYKRRAQISIDIHRAGHLKRALFGLEATRPPLVNFLSTGQRLDATWRLDAQKSAHKSYTIKWLVNLIARIINQLALVATIPPNEPPLCPLPARTCTSQWEAHLSVSVAVAQLPFARKTVDNELINGSRKSAVVFVFADTIWERISRFVI